MATRLSIRPTKNGTAVVTILAKDENGRVLGFDDLINPQFQLMAYGDIIVNNLSFENSNMTSLDVVLTGDDLKYIDSRESGERVFTFKAQYNSSAGYGLHLTGECEFYISDISGIPVE